MRALVVLLGLLSGCASGPLRITDSGFRNDRLEYEILFRSGGRQLLPDDWRLDNFYGEEGKTPKLKTAASYMSEVQLDLDGDGKQDRKEEVPTYELRFEHRHSNGIILLSTMILDEHDQHKDLRLLSSDIVGSIAGGYDFRLRGAIFTSGNVRFAARPIAEGPAKLAGQEAYSTVIDIANVDQSLISAPSVIRRAKIVLIRSGLVFKPTQRDNKFPVYLCAQYIEHPTQFEAHLPAFMQLLKQIKLAEHIGYEESLSQLAPSSESPAPQQGTPQQSAPTDSPKTVVGPDR